MSDAHSSAIATLTGTHPARPPDPDDDSDHDHDHDTSHVDARSLAPSEYAYSAYGGYGGAGDHSLLSVADPAEFDELQDSVRQSRTIEDFTRIISEFRSNRLSQYEPAYAASTCGDGDRDGDGAGSEGYDGGKRKSTDEEGLFASAPGGGGTSNLRYTCCCAREECEQARRAAQDWRDMEADLRLSAGESHTRRQ